MKLTLEEFFKLLSKYEVEEIEGLRLEGDIEIEIEEGAGFAHVVNEINLAMQHLMNALSMLGAPVSLPGVEVPAAPAKEHKMLLERRFEPFRVEYPGQIQEVQLGATRSEGGSRERVIKLGGEKSLPFYLFDASQPNLPAISIDVFDKPVPLPKAVREHYEDVMSDPAEWAKKVVNKFGADAVTIHLISTDPLLDDTPPGEAVKVVEDVLQAVKVPIIVGGSGNKEKDPIVLEKVAEVAEGERVMLASATLDMDWERIGNAAKEYGHVVLSWTQMDMNSQKTLNRYLLKRLGLPRDSLVMDPTTAALGYGLDYAYTNMERIRLSGLKGDEDLAFPISSGTTNAWGAREAWMKDSPIEGDTPWGPRELRGPLWEIVTGLTLSLAGVDIFMMMHPASVAVLKELISTLGGRKGETKVGDWVGVEL
ncbi:CO dehydrogenase/acetyl-CoA synthase subunit delta [Archaeoglobus veneficus]|uniref:Acetyl-CoA decarbonylase/synthase complex subunit delta n=1 Tax=Archaeoglobus veneficus (strain DSM 11195 / SNP6) TaxID=693661 RepID=F2KTA5_ARCVS|nr:CO dehydrogenase/acetyl-CoA synthase subunit delta [Archaeoglobus veneficus]AEA47135.1 CO dehydrogenase/acetyl-CoA synthase, delta subunit [Archaeoglobus veneficus SNP6]